MLDQLVTTSLEQNLTLRSAGLRVLQAQQQLAIAIGRRKEAPGSLSSEIRRILDQVGLAHTASAALPRELSGGMAQRAALAIAVAPKPRLVIADEPETGLDPVLRRAVIELLVTVCRDEGAGLLLISHHASTVNRIADDIVRLRGPDGEEGGA